MKINKALLVSVALSAGLLSAPLANASPWTFYASGIIADGYDADGVFGATNADLAGQTYSQLYTLDPTTYMFQSGVGFGVGDHDAAGGLTGGTASDTVTVGGVSKTYTWDLSQTNFGESHLNNYLTGGNFGYSDEAYQYQNGYTTDGFYIDAKDYVTSSINSMNLGLGFDQVWSYNVQSGDIAGGNFYATDTTNITTGLWFDTSPTCISINNGASCGTNNIPEPGTLALLGLGLLGFMARRRNNFTT